MNSEIALLGLILAGTGLCLAYFWAEIARRNQDRQRFETKLAGDASAGKGRTAEARNGLKTDRRKAA